MKRDRHYSGSPGDCDADLCNRLQGQKEGAGEYEGGAGGDGQPERSAVEWSESGGWYIICVMRRPLLLILFSLAAMAQQPSRDLRVDRVAPGTVVGDRGTRWAVVVGVSSYRYLPPAAQLHFAHRDAEEFARFLRGPAGGSLAADHVRLLTNEQATLAQVRSALETWLVGLARPEDVVYLFLAGHGVLDDNNDGYFVAHDSDPQNLHATALSFQELDATLGTRLKAGLVVLIADACHAGRLGWSSYVAGETGRAAESLAQIGQGDRSLLKLLASRPSEPSFEDAEWNGGHGVFTQALLEGLNGEADGDRDGVIRASETIDYVSRRVPELTEARQHPRVAGTFDARVAIATPGKPAPVISKLRVSGPFLQLQARLEAGRVLEPDGAYDYYRSHTFTDAERPVAGAQVAAALEELGQACVTDYVQSSTVGLKQAILLRSVEAYGRLRVLRPYDGALEVRQLFCRGRLDIAEQRFAEAVPVLERTIKLDSRFACAYNALGVALERINRRGEARKAFETAAKLTPEWALPQFQIASQLLAAGERSRAVAYLEKAVAFHPGSVVARWNLVHVDRLLGRTREVERQAEALIGVAPNYAPTYLELGLAYEAAHNFTKAAEAYDAYVILAQNYVGTAAVRERAAKLRGRRP